MSARPPCSKPILWAKAMMLKVNIKVSINVNMKVNIKVMPDMHAAPCCSLQASPKIECQSLSLKLGSQQLKVTSGLKIHLIVMCNHKALTHRLPRK